MPSDTKKNHKTFKQAAAVVLLAVHLHRRVVKAKARTAIMAAKEAKDAATAVVDAAVVDAGWSFDDDLAPPPCRQKSCK
jgi:hypothetical protein